MAGPVCLEPCGAFGNSSVAGMTQNFLQKRDACAWPAGSADCQGGHSWPGCYRHAEAAVQVVLNWSERLTSASNLQEASAKEINKLSFRDAGTVHNLMPRITKLRDGAYMFCSTGAVLGSKDTATFRHGLICVTSLARVPA